MLEADLVKSGIKGLDEVLFGGIPRGNIILVAGTAGTGKTTLGVEFVYRGARQFNEPGVIVLFEVARIAIATRCTSGGTCESAAGRLRWCHDAAALPAAIQRPTARSFPRPPRLARGGSSLTASAGCPSPMAATPRGLPSSGRGAAPRESDGDAGAGVDVGGPCGRPSAEEFVADTILKLSIEPVQRAVLRSVEVVKSRGHEYALGRHSFRIVNGQGLEVYRRVQAPVACNAKGAPRSTRPPGSPRAFPASTNW